MEIDINIKIPNAVEVVEREVKAVGNGAAVFVPKKWLGSKVKVVRVADK